MSPLFFCGISLVQALAEGFLLPSTLCIINHRTLNAIHTAIESQPIAALTRIIQSTLGWSSLEPLFDVKKVYMYHYSCYCKVL